MFPSLYLAPAYNSLTGSRVLRRSCDLFEESSDTKYGGDLSIMIREGHLQKAAAEQQLKQFSSDLPKKEVAEFLLTSRERGDMPWPGYGPPERTRKLYGAEIIAIAQGESGEWAHARWISGCAYEVSAITSVTGALVLAEELQDESDESRMGGVLTPAFAFHRTTWLDRIQAVPFANRGGQNIVLEVKDGKPSEEVLKNQISARNQRLMMGCLDRQPSEVSRAIGFGSQAPKVKPGVAREDPAPARISMSQSFTLSASSTSPLQPRSGSMQLPVRSQRTPREHWQAAVPAAPPPSPSIPSRQRMAKVAPTVSVPSVASPRVSPAVRPGVAAARAPLHPSNSVASPLLRVRSVEPPHRVPRMVSPQHRMVPRLDLAKLKRR
eukprot:symbB.v1.2.007858.t1/scaffold448.1/size203282/10